MSSCMRLRSRSNNPDSKDTLAQRWPNNISYVGPTLAFDVGQSNVAHRGMVGPTVGVYVGPTSNHHSTTSI